MFSNALRALVLAAAVVAPFAASAQQVQFQTAPLGPVAVGSWAGSATRTPLASNPMTPEQTAQRFLELSGATGGIGQHG